QQEGQPLQLIAPHGELPLVTTDLSGLEPSAARAELERRLREELLTPFNLSTGPLMRAQLLKLGPTDHVLALNMHHIVSDGWSLGVLVREVGTLYAAFSEGRPSPLRPLPIQYADYAVWQRQWLQGAVLDEQLAYWKQHLAGAATLELPTDKPRPPVQTFNGGKLPVALPAGVSQQLQALCQREGATPFMALLAAFQVLLSRYSGQQDISVGSPIAGRQRGETEGLIGFFVNTLVMRTQLDARHSFRDVLRQVKEAALGAYAHQDVPFERLVEELQPARDMSRSPLFQASFALQNTPMPEGQGQKTAVTLRPVDAVDNPTIKFELQLNLMETPDGYQGSFGYNTDLFESTTAQRMAEHFRVLVEALVTQADAPLASVPMLTQAERQQVLQDWNTAAPSYPRDATLPEVFAHAVARYGDKVAVELGEERLTYRQLDARANQLAHHLRGLGVSTDSRVAIALERSLELIVSLVAIIKAGGAYVPLDASYPRERLAVMVEDARPGVLITSRELLSKLPGEGLSTVVLGEVSLEGQPTSAPPVAALPQSLAYIDFTSGSTGRPKGVGTPQAAVLRTLLGTDYTHFGPAEVLLQFAPISFDASTFEIWGALLHGARLVVMPPQAASLEELGHVIQSSGVTTLWATIGLFTQLVDTPPPGLLTLKHVMTGGDVVSPAHVRRAGDELRLHVTAFYGPTETTVFATSYPVGEQVERTVPIGRPIAGTRLYVLDAYGQPVPVGVTGELFIGGDGVARGYVGQPALTAERFIPDAFGSEPGARLYRTGDLVRWRGDGVLDFVGRADTQVKLRGFRIELAEVEAALLAFPDVAQAVALVREDVPGDKRLVGYVAAPESLDASALRAALKQRLPEYMVPSALVRLDTLPLTANAKVDRKALPAPDAALISKAESFVAPRNPTEEQLAALWAQVLRVQRIGVHDNFFELGGHSLLATQVISRIRSQLRVELPLRALFEASTVAALAERIESASGTQAPAIIPVPRAGPLPLSFAQQRLWFIDQLQPGSASYNIPIFMRMEGPLDSEALRRSFEELARRHEALRTSFTQQEGQPLQVIAPHGELPLVTTDLSGLEPSAARAELERRLREELLTPFNLSTGPLMRAQLLKLGATDHVLALNMHHIVSDGWSLGVLVREMGALYSAFSEGRPSPLRPLPIQYADYAVWQRQWLQGAVLDEQLAWWKQHLAGAVTLELPTDKPRPPVQTFRGAHVHVALSRTTSEKLQALCQQEGATPFMALLAAFQVLLSRYSGQQDISVGSPIAGRQRGELEGLIGFFVNTLVMRARLDDQSSFLHLLRRVKETALEAYTHQDVPFERLVEELQPARDMSRSPLFQVLFALQNAPTASAEQSPEQARKPALALRQLEGVDNPTVRFELELSLSETSEGFQGPLRYNTDLFEPSTAARMAEHFQVLVEALVTQTDAPLASVPMLTQAERRQVLQDWSIAAPNYPRDATLPEVFAHVVARHADKVAVEFGTEKLTYRQLDERSNLLAHHLRRLGVGADSRVALAVERSPELIVSLVAILKAGGAYVPLDPSYPQARLAGMLEDTRPQALVTTRALLPRLPADGLSTVVLEDAALSSEPTHALTPAALPDSLAYVDFTSGSTGRPKGVGTTHRGVLRTLLGTDYAHFGPDEVLLQFAPISFDASTFEIWGALLHGARLVVMPPHAASLEELGRVIESSGVTTLWATIGLFTQLVDTPPPGLLSLKHVMTGGDVVSPAHVRRAVDELSLPVTAFYGPTETTVFATSYPVGEQVERTVPIGRPIAGTRLYVLDAYGQPVPVGVTGELFIGGDGVARGYVGQPALTAERFIPDAFGSEPGARLYRTGDLVRWRGDGVLDFVGRADTQVKLRGFRIELAEVEAALLAFPDVAQAVALVREDVPGDKRLVGYVAAPESLDLAALRASLKQRLPEYMVPSALVRLDILPLTANAKVDRKALPPPDAAPTSPEDFVAPRTPTEAKLAEMFAGVLRLPQVSVTGNFFELGGHSLLATQLISRIRSTFDVELPLRALFEASTVAALAERINAPGASNQGAAPPLIPVPRTGPLPLSFAQQRLWFIDQLQPGSASYNMPTFVRMDGPLDVTALQRSFEELVRRHEALRTSFSQQEGQPLQLIAPHGELPLVTTDLSGLEPSAARAELERRLREELLTPFNLSTGPLMRAQLLKLGPTDHVLALNMHHIVSDGWSLGVLVREVGALYAAFSEGRPSPLRPLPIQYADYAVWQRQWLQGAVLDEQLAYWKQHLSGAATLELPTDKPRPPVQTFNGGKLPVALPAGVSQQLQALCQREGATPFMALLAAFQVLLSRYSGQQDISVGSPIAGRQRGELEGLIGFFVNTLVMRTQLDARHSFRDVLRQVKEAALGAYAHQDVPFERLVEELQPARDMSRSPLFQVLFALQNVPTASAEQARKPALALRPLDAVDNPTVRFELELSLSETPEGFQGPLRYNTDLFEPATAARLAEHFQVLVEALVTQADAPLASISMLTQAERRQVLVDWNATATEYPRGSTLPEVFSQVVSRHADKVAVEFGEEKLTYRQLDARANQLAWHLRGLGVSTDSRVAIALDRSLELIVSLVAILKAGGAYVPLDPSYPRGRLAAMVEDARPGVLLTSRELLSKLPTEGLTTVVLGEVSLDTQPTSAPPAAALPQSLAYIDFTSGSTGRPKGVGTPQAAVLRTIFGNDYAHLGPDETFLLIAPVSFDASTLELWGPLLHGARLVVFPPHSPSDLNELEAVLVKHGVTTLHLTAGLFTQVVDNNFPALRNVKQLLTGGDVVSAPHVRRVLEELRIPVTACYGPTETTLFASTHRMTDVEHVGPSVPIGKPIGNTQVYVLDASGQPVPAGIVGELFIGGDGVARGYVEQPALTAERFVPDAFSGVAGARLYRTGDLARWRKDGTLEFLGRADAQVKVRGYRIELAEVEAALLAFPDVAQAVALVREDVPGDKRLVGYLAAPESLDLAALRTALKQRLPEYMVPSALVRLDTLPLTANAKVDRKALPAPDAALISKAESFVAPRNPTEEKLAELFAAVLRLPQVSITGNFFELGGHSLLATQVISRIRSTFDVELPLRALFEASTVAALAERINAPGAFNHRAALPLIPVPRTGPLPLSFAQQRLWFIDQLQPGSASYNMPTFVRMDGPLDVDALRRGLEALVLRHEALRTTFTQQEGQLLQVISPQGQLPLEVTNLSGLEPSAARAELERRLREELLTPFNLSTGPLMRAQLFELGPTDHVLALNLHHIVSDGWSMGVLVREVAALYDAFSQGRSSPLPPLPLQYADYAVWQRQWLQGAVLDEQLGWWRKQLSGLSALELPTDKPRPPVQTFRGAHVPVALSRAATEKLKALCHEEGLTPFMALLAAFQVLLSRYSGQQDVSVGSPIAGRQRGELEGLIGFFINTLVMRAHVDDQSSFLDLLRRVKETALGAYAHQDVPFERLVEELQPARDMSRSPLFQVIFALQNAPTAASRQAPEQARKPVLALRPMEEVNNPTVRFELELSLSESSEGFQGPLRYNTDLFEPATAARMAEHFQVLVEALVARPNTPLASISMLTETERRQVLVEWNATATEYPRGSTLPEVFAQVVARHGDKVAVEFGEEKLTYRQLDARANQLAWHLRGLGVSTDSRVAIALDRSLELIVSLVAILKAGGAYVPLDPSYPRERLAAMVEDARPRVLITSRDLLPKLPTKRLVTLVMEDVPVEEQPVHAPPSTARPESLAYIDFTSGSTGRPKGVGTPQSAVLRTVFGNDYAHLGPDETFLLIAPVSFDASTLELWGPLLHGARLVVFPPHSPSDLKELESVLVKHGVTTLHLTAGLFTQVVDNNFPALRGVKQLLTGGDVVSA
ncbi:non-ribosomal peptide synthetase, partial [Pyxidicoccus caerfyrddinensis]|uniref:non-ribosomal peptide synthetase n=1 Tax=Pyxidicoccus caerfyrddinensis TaxID=2709663 RepID=UPI0013DBCD16